jgi:predicted transcriptional regulator of viral defense system
MHKVYLNYVVCIRHGSQEDFMRGQVERFVEETQSQGRYSFDIEELRSTVTLSQDGLGAALRRLTSAGSIIRLGPKRGFFVIVPAEYRTMGAPPLAWWLDAFMSYLGQVDYYVGLLAAAEWHGSAHYAMQETQVIVSTQIRPIRIGRERIRFVKKSDASATAVERRFTEGGSVRVSTPEATAVDLVGFATLVGGPSRIATVLSEMRLCSRALHRALEVAGNVTIAQRLGYLLEIANQSTASRAVARFLAGHERRIRPLDPSAPTGGADVAEAWGILVNSPVEVG